MVRVKICGITSIRDAENALLSGADALGFVFAKSPRRVTLKTAKAIVKAVGPWIATVGVFVNEDPRSIANIVYECGLSCVQMHGDETPDYVQKLDPCRTIKAFRVAETSDLRHVADYEVDAFLFDAKVKGMYGGTGKKFDWKILASRKWKRPVILSGGMDPKNVKEAVLIVKPYGVDVSSGVESSPGIKNSKLVKEFIRNAKSA